ncbi:ATP-grasp domain-containing protein [Acetobacteraceae bacterium]|nr:ATP-grasp domain-containing protein [Acetobacteraceae bacterium]
MFKKKSQQQKKGNIFSIFEFWPNEIFYTPIVFYWILKTLQSRKSMTALLANPRIETGGLCGESKSSILNMAGDWALKEIAPYVVMKNNQHTFSRLNFQLQEKNITFPIVIKPDIGSNGIGVKKITSQEQLKQVLNLFPFGITLIAQKLIDFPLEAGIFFIRYPTKKYGKITSITYKEEPMIIGDGKSSILELAQKNKRIAKLFTLYWPYIKPKAHQILQLGEIHTLVFAGNHRRGSIFWNGTADLTPALEQKINKILQDIPEFYFGRIDLKAKSKTDLFKGQNFKIIEINGVGSEATHIWDRQTKLLTAYRDQFSHYDAAFKIGKLLKKQTWMQSSLLQLIKAWKKHQKLISSYPRND